MRHYISGREITYRVHGFREAVEITCHLVPSVVLQEYVLGSLFCKQWINQFSTQFSPVPSGLCITMLCRRNFHYCWRNVVVANE